MAPIILSPLGNVNYRSSVHYEPTNGIYRRSGKAHNYYMDRRQLHAKMIAAFCAINAEYFGNVLPRPRFYVAKLQTASGMWYTCKDDKQRITFDSLSDWNDLSIMQIMAHEMIHAAQWISTSARIRNEIHGKFFQAQHRRIFGCDYKIGLY